MGKNSFLLYLAVGFAMTMAVWGLMGGCSSEKTQSLSSREESAPDPELVKIPSSSDKLPMEETTQRPPARKVEKKSVETVKPPVRVVTETRVAEHVVQKGETLWGISQKYKTTVEAIMDLNQMKAMGIHVGQRLRVKTKMSHEEITAAAAPKTVPSADPVKQSFLQDRKIIAESQPVPSEQPVPPQPLNVIAASQPAAMPVEMPMTTAPTPAPAPIEAPAKKEEAPPQPYTGELLTHEVKDGETLAAIATQYQTSKSFLQDINGLTDNSELQAGQILLVPEKNKP